MPTAYSYIRFSTPEQKKGDSLRRQKELSEQYANDHGLTLDTSLHLHDLGISAFDGSNVTRGALGGFLKAVDEGRVASGSYLLVESLDRLSRDRVMEALNLFLSIVNRGITIVTLSDGRVYNSDTDNTADLIVSITIMARAHEESLTKSKRLKAAWTNKRSRLHEKKLTARCPLWMKLSDDRTQFEFIPERVTVVREVIALAKNGMGQTIIAKTLNAQSIPSFSGNPKGWHPSYIQKILTSTALYGAYQPGIFEGGRAIPHGEPVADYYPALISKEEFYALQAYRSQNAVGGGKARKGETVPNLLSGLLRCGYCGSPMVIAGAAARRVRSEDGKEVQRPPKKVLVCDGGRRGLGCYAVQWGHKDFETSFLSFCRGVEFEKVLADVRSDHNESRELTLDEKIRGTEAEIFAKDARIKNLMVAIEDGNAPASLVERIRLLEEETAELTRAKTQLSTELNLHRAAHQELTSTAQNARSLIDTMGSMENDELFRVRAALAAQFRRAIASVTLHPAGRLFTHEQVEKQRTLLIETGLGVDQVDRYVTEMYPTEPRRQGRGNSGRYASRKDIGRFFTIETVNGGFRVIYPDFDDPTVAKIDASIEGRAGFIATGPDSLATY
ncbi:recombinase family protein [Burkholderia sp. B21-005]|uniref:recombinase family protein n=1 Tax=Burkholderia sp. B21-005 TaxID=2890406 RepID=UPI001E52949B|nr:recombinase family protein [Burkholderia sp. B21-005]UEP40314.1 recombinase family protein [Burkholderia sp. B21-005]